MKIKVISEFKDRHTDEIHKVGDVLDVTAERLVEIESAQKGIVAVVNDVTDEPAKEQKVSRTKKKGE